MAWKVSADVEEFTQAVEAFRRRVPVTPELAATVNGFTHDRGFTIAGVTQLDVVNDVHESIAEAIRKGIPFEQWQKETGPKLTAAWGRKDSPRLETIFRNATMQAYNAGRREQMLQEDVAKFRPFWMFDGVIDLRTSDICRECDGTVLRFDDPWWNTHSPQLHHRCRSTIRNIRKTDADRIGVTQVPTNTNAAEGFGLPPGASEPWKPELSKYAAPLAATFAEKLTELEAAPSVELAATPVLRRKAAEFRQALELNDGGKRARDLVREQVAESLPGAVPRNTASPFSHVVSIEKRLPALGSYDSAEHAHPGLVRLRPDRVEGAKQVAASFAYGKTPSADAMEKLGTIVHEEIHGHSKLSGRVYTDSPVSRALEEIGTELNARHVMLRLHPEFDPAWDSLLDAKRLVGRQSYDDEINSLTEVVELYGNVTKAEAQELIRAAHYKSSLTIPGRWANGHDATEAFLRELDVADSARQTIRNRLPKLFPPP